MELHEPLKKRDSWTFTRQPVTTHVLEIGEEDHSRLVTFSRTLRLLATDTSVVVYHRWNSDGLCLNIVPLLHVSSRGRHH
jgi:hypothetical protein